MTAGYLIGHGKPKSVFGKTSKVFGHRSKIMGEGISEKGCIVLLLSLCKVLVSWGLMPQIMSPVLVRKGRYSKK